MADKIGIEVDVKFPSASELQRKLETLWSGVKDKIDLKVNISADKNSLKSLKRQIQTLINEEKFEVKIGTDIIQAQKSVHALTKEIRDLTSKEHNIKLKVSNVSMDSSLRDMLENSKAIEKATKAMNQRTKESASLVNAEKEKYDSLIKSVGKLRREKIKATKDGNVRTNTAKSDGVEGTGLTRTDKFVQGKRTELEYSLDISKAENDIVKKMREINAVQQKMNNASGEQKDILEAQEKALKGQFNEMAKNYEELHGALSDSQRIMGEASKLDFSMTLSKAKDKAKEMKEEESEIASKLSEMIGLESKISALKIKRMNASNNEKVVLEAQIDNLQGQADKIEQTYDLSKKINSEQQAELQNIRSVNYLEEQRAKAKMRDKEYSEDQKQALELQKEAQRDILAEMKEVYNIKAKIAQIESRANNGLGLNEKSKSELLLQRELLQGAEKRLEQTRQNAREEGTLTKEVEDGLRAAENAYQADIQRASAIAKAKGEQEKFTSLMNDYAKSIQRVNQLQRDLVFSGQREAKIVEEAISEEKSKLNAIKEQVNASNLLTESRKEEMTQIERNLEKERELNRTRQSARDKDRETSTAHGVVDFNSTASNYRMGFEEVLREYAEFDEGYMKIKKVANESDKVMEDYKKQAFDTASSIGVSASDYNKAVENWITSGENLVDSQKLAKQSLMGSFVGNIDADKMVKYMAVPMNAFKDAGVEVDDILNIMNETSNQNAIEMEDLGKAYARSAVSVETTGSSFEELTGMVTGAQEATRMGGERIGTALKTISTNYQSIKSQFSADDKKKFNYLKSLGIDLDKTDDVYDFFDKLHAKFKDMSSTEQSNALKMISGKEHINIANGIIKQWNTVKESVKTAQDQMGRGTSGSAYQEFAKQQDSVKFKLAELKNSWSELMNTIAESGQVKDILQTLSTAIQKVTSLMQNDAFMNVAKITAYTVAIIALSNGFRKMLDLGRTGFGNIAKDIIMAKNGLKDIGSVMARKQTLAGIGKNGGHNDATLFSGGKGKATNAETARNTGGASDISIISDGGAEKAKKVGKEADGAKTKVMGMGNTIKGTTKLVGKLAHAIPFVGTALTVMDIAGIDVFGKLGKLIDKTTDKTEKLSKSTKELYQKQSDIGGEQQAIDNVKPAMKDARYTMNNAEKTRGYLTADEFKNVKASMQKQADALHMKIKIDDNNLPVLKKQMKEIEAEAKKMQASLNVKMAKKIGKDSSNINDIKKENNEIQTRNNKLKKSIKMEQDYIKEVKKKMKNGTANAGEISAMNSMQKSIKKETKELKENNKAIKSNNSAMKVSKESISENARNLLKQGSAVKVNTKDQKALKATVKAVNSEYKKMKNTNNAMISANKKVNSTAKLSAKEWNSLKKLYPNVAKKYGDLSAKEVNSSAKIKSSVKSMVNSTTKDHNKATATAKKAADAIDKQGESASKAGEKASSASAGHDKNRSSMDKEKESAHGLKGAIDRIKGKTVKVDVKHDKSVVTWLDTVGAKILGLKSKTVTVAVHKTVTNFLKNLGGQDDNISSGTSNNISLASGVLSGTSNSISSNSSTSTSYSKSSKKSSSKKKSSSSNNSRVDSEIWRYSKVEKKIEDAEYAINNLERVINSSSTSLTKAIKESNKEIKELTHKNKVLATYESEKKTELKSVLSHLRKLGFKTKGSDVTNIGHAKYIKGSSAEKAEEYLSKWKQLLTDIKDIKGQQKDNGENIKEIKIGNEAKEIEKKLEKTNRILDLINARSALSETKLGLVDSKDYELNSSLTKSSVKSSKKNVNDLINEYNKLATMKVKNKENAETVYAQMQTLGDSIMSEVQNINTLNNTINEIAISKLTEDFQKFSNVIGLTTNSLKTTNDTLSKGLLSGQNLGSLYSTKSFIYNTKRNYKFNKPQNDITSAQNDINKTLENYKAQYIDKTKTGISSKDMKLSKYKTIVPDGQAEKDRKKAFDDGIKKAKADFLKTITTAQKKRNAELKKTKDKKKRAIIKDNFSKAYNSAVKTYNKKADDLTKKYKQEKPASHKKTVKTNQEKYEEVKKKNKKTYDKAVKAENARHKKEMAKLKSSKTKKAENKKHNSKLSSIKSAYTKANKTAYNKYPYSVPKTTTKKATVKSGETVSKLAKRLGVTVSDLIKWNKSIKSSKTKLKKGQKVTYKKPVKKTTAKKTTAKKKSTAKKTTAKKKATAKKKTTAKKTTAKKKTTTKKLTTAQKKKQALDKAKKSRKSKLSSEAKRHKNALKKAKTKKAKDAENKKYKANVKKINDSYKKSVASIKKKYTTNAQKKASELKKAKSSYNKKVASENKSYKAKLKKAKTKKAKNKVIADHKKKLASLKKTYEKTVANIKKKYATKKTTSTKKTTTKKATNTASDYIEVESEEKEPAYLKNLRAQYAILDKDYQQLTKDFNDSLASATKLSDVNLLTNKYTLRNLELQADYINANIEANKKGIEEYNNQLKNTSLTTTQIEEINDNINSLVSENISLQSSLQDAVQARFDYEFSAIEKSIGKYDKIKSNLDYYKNVIDDVSPQNYDAISAIYSNMLAVEKARNIEENMTLVTLKEQMKSYKEGTFEWNLLNEQVETYRTNLQNSNTELIKMNKEIMNNSFNSILEKMNVGLFGMGSEDYKQYQELWVDGIEKEIKLNQMEQRLNDAKTDQYRDQLKLLGNREKVGQTELDFLDKQIDLLEAQEKLETLESERTVQTLKQNVDGTWNWDYVANPDDEDGAKSDLADKQLALEQAKKDAKQSYLSAIDNVNKRAGEGGYSTEFEYQKAIQDVNDAFSSMITLPDTSELTNAFREYIAQNNQIIDTVNTVATSNTNGAFNEDVKATVTELGSTISDAITSGFNEILKSVNATTNDANTGQQISITLGSLEFPNITSSEGLQQAILDLPSIALQKSTGK